MELAQKGISNNFLDKKFSELEINWEKEINDLLLKNFQRQNITLKKKKQRQRQ